MKNIEPLQEIRKNHIQRVLEHTGGDLLAASAILNVTPEQLRHLLEIHHLDPGQQAENPSSTKGEE